jgi:hypothetical protein
MPTTSVKPRRARLAILAVIAVIGVIALAVAMCGPSNRTSNNGNTGKPTVSAIPPSSSASAAPPPAPAPPSVGKDYVEGLVESVSGNTIRLRTRTGSATVGFTPETRVVQVTPAQLSDVTPGSCVNVRATPQSAPGAAITAQAVTITPAIDGKCPPPAGFYGTVTSVSGNTIAVNGMGAGGQTTPTNVTVANTTSYSKQAPSSTQAIENGKCMGAQGTNDSSGVLQATIISLEACPPMGHPHHHLHLPHLHLHV